jgi:hypothetical protein
MANKIQIFALPNIYEHKKRYYLAMFLTTAVIVFNYFEAANIFLIIKLLGGYMIRVWVPPLLLLFFVLMQKLTLGKLGIQLRNIKGLNILLVMYIFFGYLSMLANELTVFYIMQSTLIMFVPLALYVVIINSFRKNSDIERILKIFFVIGFVVSLYSIYMFYYIGANAFNLEPIETRVGIRDPNEHAAFVDHGELIARPTIIGLPQDRAGGIISPLVLVGLYYGINSTVRSLKYFYFTSSLVMAFLVVSSMSRSGIAALLAGLIVFLHSYRKKISKRPMVATVVIIIISMFLINDYAVSRFLIALNSTELLSESQFFNHLVSKYDIRYTGFEAHIESIFYGLSIFSDSLIFGRGIPYIEDYYRDIRSLSVHSRYFYMLITAGLITLIPYVSFILFLTFLSRRTMLNREKFNNTINNLGLILYPSCVLFIFKLFNESMESYYYWIFFGFTAAWIRNCAYEKKH